MHSTMSSLAKLYQNKALISVFKKLKMIFFSYYEFELAYANAKDINQIIKSLNVITLPVQYTYNESKGQIKSPGLGFSF